MRSPAPDRTAALRCCVAIAVAVCLLVAAAPIAAAPAQSAGSVEYDIVVTSDGEVERGTIVWTVDENRYAALESTAGSEGYDSVARYWAENLAAEDEGLGGVSAEDREVEGGVELHMTFSEIDDERYRMMNASVADGRLSWERLPHDGGLSNPDFGTLTYRVHMPGEVTDTNAAEVDGTVATWHLNQEDPGRLYATSERGEDDAIPGFGIAAAAVAVVAALVVWTRRFAGDESATGRLR